jgi:hypothetical protein
MTKTLRTLALMAAFVVSVVGVSALLSEQAIAQIRAALVKNVDEPGRAPYQQMVEFNQVAGFGANCPVSTVCIVSFAPVPAGKRLLVEHVTLLINGFQPTFVSFGDGNLLNVQNVAIVKPDFAQGPSNTGGQSWLMDRVIRVYFEAGATPKLKVGTTAFSNHSSNASLHGYLIDAAN